MTPEETAAYHRAYYQRNRQKWKDLAAEKRKNNPNARPRRKPWTEQEQAQLVALYPYNDTAVVAKKIGKSIGSVNNQAFKMGIKKDPQYLKKILSELGKKLQRHGASNRFQKGNVPPNKGVKGWDSGGRSHETRFKPGHWPNNGKDIGATSISRDGYLQRKVTATGNQRRDWRGVHILLWEEHHGPVPKGHIVRFRDGDKSHIEISNLEMITMRENMARNTIIRYPEPLRRVMHLTAKLKRTINEKQNGGSAQSPVRDTGGATGPRQPDGS